MTNIILGIFSESYKYIAGPIIGAILAYWFGIRGKRTDIDLQKIKELNEVLANMLIVWNYLTRIQKLPSFVKEKNEVLIPHEIFPTILLKTGALNDNCFGELEKSIETLKKYDPITYYDLEGIGRRFDYVRKSYILPIILNNTNSNNSLGVISNTFLNSLTIDIEEYMLQTSRLISKTVYKSTKRKIESSLDNDFRNWQEELNQQYYTLVISLIPEGVPKPTYEEFKTEFGKPEVQEQMKVQIKIFVQKGIKESMELLSQNPAITIEELQRHLPNIEN